MFKIFQNKNNEVKKIKDTIYNIKISGIWE